jgi:prophage antirepressor-like protein
LAFNCVHNWATIIIDDKCDPCFFWKGIASILGYTNKKQAVTDHVDEKYQRKICTTLMNRLDMIWDM